MFAAMMRALFCASLLLVPMTASAQTQETPASSTELLKPQELDQLVAPIALYPDNLLAEVLMASSYPLDIVQAERWLKSHKNLKGDQLKAAMAKEDWDDSIKSLMATPDVLAMMSEKLDWTQKLGDAFLAQQKDVMATAQALRAKAVAQGSGECVNAASLGLKSAQRRCNRGLRAIARQVSGFRFSHGGLDSMKRALRQA